MIIICKCSVIRIYTSGQCSAYTKTWPLFLKVTTALFYNLSGDYLAWLRVCLCVCARVHVNANQCHFVHACSSCAGLVQHATAGQHMSTSVSAMKQNLFQQGQAIFFISLELFWPSFYSFFIFLLCFPQSAYKKCAIPKNHFFKKLLL